MKHLQLPLIICIMFSISLSAEKNISNNYIDNQTIINTVKKVKSTSSISPTIIERGIKQAASFWTSLDGTREEFSKFCEENICKTKQEKEALYYRLCYNFESIFGNNNRITIDLLMPEHVQDFGKTGIDLLFGSYNGLSHLNDDMFSNKIAFIVIINFPHFTLKEKNNNGENWTELEWGYIRLGDLFASRVPAFINNNINIAVAKAENYISNYNIYMGQVWSDANERFWDSSVKLISHWGLRDELKATYADQTKSGMVRQEILYNILTRITNQTIKEDVINNDEYIWYPSSNQTFFYSTEIGTASEKNNRYKNLLNVFKAEKEADSYYGENSDFLNRKFEDEYGISVSDVKNLFQTILFSPQVQTTAKLICKRLNRKLKPWDIWYDGFKSRSNISQNLLDSVVRSKYPDKDAFVKDLPNILTHFGFTKEKANFICNHVTVDASIGAGHAWESMMKSDNARLRTRLGKTGMDYKGYNIGIHEFGHNVEQTISLHDVPSYFLRGVPNTAFSEALAFVFQSRDIEMLGLPNQNEYDEYFNTLDIFWNCYEIMGVALVDIYTWEWLYAHSDATDTQLKDAVLRIAKEVWNSYYAPVFDIKDQIILASYSHMIDSPLYLANYPIGHIICFQIENYLKNKNIGEEVSRIYKQGFLTPNLWMQRAIGENLSANSLLNATIISIDKVAEFDKLETKKSKTKKQLL